MKTPCHCLDIPIISIQSSSFLGSTLIDFQSCVSGLPSFPHSGFGSHFSVSESLSPRLFRARLTSGACTSVHFWLLGQQQEVFL